MSYNQTKLYDNSKTMMIMKTIVIIMMTITVIKIMTMITFYQVV